MGEIQSIRSASGSMNTLAPAYTDALERALGGVVARAQGELRLVRERADAIVAAASARVSEAEARLKGLELAIAKRLDELVDGAPGKDGRDGRDGEPGPQGERGPEGPEAKFPFAREWIDRIHYDGELATLGGATYQARRATGRPPPGEDWICLAEAGAAARSFNVRGTWSEAETYHALDVVALNGASFAARRDDPGACPGEGWQLIAAQGKQGKPGERGRGERGERGPPGPAPIDLKVDAEGLITLTNADGSTLSCDLYPLLQKLAG